MNSIVRYLTPATLASTLLAMRSGRKDVFLVVEGAEDIALFSQVFRLSRSNFLDCRGKENLMNLFALIPTRGLDSGTIFLRDRDHDGVHHTVSRDVSLLVSDLYDFEMHLLDGRLFGRIMAEFLRDAGGADGNRNCVFAHHQCCCMGWCTSSLRNAKWPRLRFRWFETDVSRQ